MRDSDQIAARALGLLAVTAALTLVVRFVRKTEKRRVLREDAVKKLRESGEFFFAPLTT